MAFVLDASIAVSWFLRDEDSSVGDRLLSTLESTSALVPSLFWFEMRNVLVIAERRGRLALGESTRCLEQLRGLPIEDFGSGLDDAILRLARTRGISAYDVSYLALAKQQSLPLATTDRQLAAAARLENVDVIEH
ncbi:type II toxin-antitoxin system VapC family toxin [Rhizobium wuzhouense]|uniref:Ribonuclease VapC n=1 Tax=Rhizobium wuzhouense TaxID=1986026 RepID=A0ABX5NTE8_9HYPH|nr:type II toxin-antitoxin system VapC family toxin [Rhizobium wuzhouense]PYB71726.1 VapC toxin family PIN domain ribonuclease [Rhizobium wuzhouense]